MFPVMSKFTEMSDNFYDQVFKNYEKWLAVPALILLFSLGVIGMSYYNNGSMVSKGIDFTGGSEIQFLTNSSVTKESVRTAFSEDLRGVNVREMSEGKENKWMIVQTQTDDVKGSETGFTEKIETLLSSNNIYFRELSIKTVGGAVSSSFMFEAQLATGIAFLIMSTAIFIAFRDFVPSIAVIIAAFTDIVFSIAGMNILGIDLTLGSLAALLMLIGYSVDTDIVLSTRVLKQKEGTLKERIKDSIATGVTMSGGGILAFIILLTLSTSPVLDQIAGVMIMGLVADMPITWFGNAAILKMYEEGGLN